MDKIGTIFAKFDKNELTLKEAKEAVLVLYDVSISSMTKKEEIFIGGIFEQLKIRELLLKN